MTNELLTKESVSETNWKEIGITFGITLLATTVAILVAQTLILPAITKAKEKLESSKDKEAKK